MIPYTPDELWLELKFKLKPDRYDMWRSRKCFFVLVDKGHEIILNGEKVAIFESWPTDEFVGNTLVGLTRTYTVIYFHDPERIQ